MNHIQQHNHKTKPDLSICQKNSTERAMKPNKNVGISYSSLIIHTVKLG